MEPQACFQELFPAIFFVSEGDDADQAAGKLLETLEQHGIRLLNIDLGLGPFENRGDEGSLEVDAGDVRAGSLLLFRFLDGKQRFLDRRDGFRHRRREERGNAFLNQIGNVVTKQLCSVLSRLLTDFLGSSVSGNKLLDVVGGNDNFVNSSSALIACIVTFTAAADMVLIDFNRLCLANKS